MLASMDIFDWIMGLALIALIAFAVGGLRRGRKVVPEKVVGEIFVDGSKE